MKKIFALLAVAAVGLFVVGCGGETKKPAVNVKKDDKGTKVEATAEPGKETNVKVEDKGAEGSKTEVTTEPAKTDAPKDEPKAEDKKDEPKAEDKKDEPKADAPKADEKKEDK